LAAILISIVAADFRLWKRCRSESGHEFMLTWSWRVCLNLIFVQTYIVLRMCWNFATATNNTPTCHACFSFDPSNDFACGNSNIQISGHPKVLSNFN